jgi:hypothetical protein
VRVGGGDGVRKHLSATHGQLMALLGDFLLLPECPSILSTLPISEPSLQRPPPAPFPPQFYLTHSRLIFLAPPPPLPLPTRTATSRCRLPTAGPSAVSMAKTASPPPAALRYAAGGQKKQAAITRVVVDDCLLSGDWMFQRSIHYGSTTSPSIHYGSTTSPSIIKYSLWVHDEPFYPSSLSPLIGHPWQDCSHCTLLAGRGG